MTHKTILFVDDEKDITDMLRYNLRKEGYDVLTANDGSNALKLAEKKPDLILLDVLMPEINGLEVVRRLKRRPELESVPIVFLTAKGSETDEIVGLELGAEDYIVKPISIGKLLARIRTILRRGDRRVESEGGNEKISIGELEIDVPSFRVRIGGKETPFVRKEFEVLVFLARRSGRVVSREDILNGVWGEKVYIVDRTVDVHVRKIREKLGKHADYIETIKGVGYRMRE